MTIRGGFDNGLTVLSGDIGIQQTNTVTDATDLSSLTGNSFNPDDPGYKDNCYHVLCGLGVTGVALYNLVITGGNADYGSCSALELEGMSMPKSGSLKGETLVPLDTRVAGGGLLLTNVYERPLGLLAPPTVVIANCWFVNNAAINGGGAWDLYSNPRPRWPVVF